MLENKDGLLKRWYAELTPIREPYLQRARACAMLTIPALMPPSGFSASTPLPTPYQSLGARGVNHLAAKLLLTLLPPNQSIFRQRVDDFTLQKLTKREGMRAAVEEALDSYERAVMTDIESSGSRPSVFEITKQLLVCGNILAFDTPKSGLRPYRLDSYVVKRDPMGNVLRIITHERISKIELPPEIRDMVERREHENEPGDDKRDSVEDTEDLYTGILRTESGWEIWQEVCGQFIPNSYGTYPEDKCPWMPLRLIRVPGEDYGRSYVEEYIGSLNTLEGLTKAIVQSAAASAKVIFLVKPGSSTDPRVLTNSQSGDVRAGNAEDIGTVQAEKYADLRVPYDTVQRLTEQLSYVFLLNSAIQREGERVTAQEIRYMADELETAMGGIYSNLAQEFQLPYVRVRIANMERQGRLPKLPKGIVSPTIVTGVEALGRGNDRSRLTGFLNDLAPLGPEAISQEMNIGDYIKRVGTSYGIDMKGLVPTPEEKAQRDQQAQQMALVQKLGPQAVTQLGGIARDSLNNPSTQGTPNG